MTYQEARDECHRDAIKAGALEPQGLKERVAAGIMVANGQSWQNSRVAQERLESWIQECVRRKGLG